MTREDIIRIAKECGYWSGQTIEMNDVGIERFASIIAKHERESCAETAIKWNDPESETNIAFHIYEAILSKGEI